MTKDAALAREVLDLLSLLREKTRGTLALEEERFFDSLLTRSPAQVRRGVPPLTAPRSAASSQARAVAIVCMLVFRHLGRCLGERGGRPVRPRGPEQRVASPRHTHRGPGRTAGRGPCPGGAAGPSRPRGTARRSGRLHVLHLRLRGEGAAAGRASPGGHPASPLWRGAGLGGAAHGDRRRGRGIRPSLRPARHPGPPGQRAVPGPIGPDPDVDRGHLHRPDRARRGALAIIAQYFRSARVKAWAALQDGSPR